ncbi:hypothetical protein QZH41_005168 [Actinostola sp. cb2023]|nr:hypothetical protein QZH41_005168 [Actinostola sp. cb2023]
MFMSVTTIHGEQPSTDLNSPKAASYKGRIFFIGNLELGHAWFNISNVTRNDTNKYALGIRTEKDTDYVIYAFNMTVVKRTDKEKEKYYVNYAFNMTVVKRAGTMKGVDTVRFGPARNQLQVIPSDKDVEVLDIKRSSTDSSQSSSVAIHSFSEKFDHPYEDPDTKELEYSVPTGRDHYQSLCTVDQKDSRQTKYECLLRKEPQPSQQSQGTDKSHVYEQLDFDQLTSVYQELDQILQQEND